MDQQADHFAILGVTHDATEAEIRKRYRVLSLQLHPDKSSLPAEEAARRFDEVNKAYTFLQDPAVRLQMAQRSQAERAKAERRGAFDGKRKAMAEELERSEHDGKAKRRKEASEQRQRSEKVQRLKEQAKQQLKEQSQRTASAVTAAAVPAPDEEAQPDLGPLDLTVRLRFPSDQFQSLCTQQQQHASSSSTSRLTTPLALALSSRFGQLQALLVTPPKVSSSTGKASREASALATFETLDAAYAAVSLGSELRAAGPRGSPSECLQDVHIAWAAAGKSKGAAAQTGEPARISWLRSNGLLANRTAGAEEEEERARSSSSTAAAQVGDEASSKAPPIFSFTSTHSLSSTDTSAYEDSTLLRLRERQRIEEQIRREEGV